MSNINQALAPYADSYFKTWQAKLVGPKPTAEMLHTVHMLNARPGKQALAIAMALRPEGVTGSEIVIVCSAPQLNKMRGYVDDAILRRVLVPMRDGRHSVYKLELTAKGKQMVERTEKRLAALAAAGEKQAAEKPVKAKAEPVKKPRKAKAKQVTVNDTPVTETATAEPTPVNEPVVEQGATN